MVWGCLCIKPWREEGLQPSPWHVAVLPFAHVKACRITPSSAQEQPELQMREASAAGPPVGFSIQTSWESTSYMIWCSEKAGLSQAPLLWTGQVTLSQAPQPLKQPWECRGLGRLSGNEAAVSILTRTELLQPCSPHGLPEEMLHPNQPNEMWFKIIPLPQETDLSFNVTIQLIKPCNMTLRISIIVSILWTPCY